MTNQTLSVAVAEPKESLSTTATPRRSTALLILSGLWLIVFFAALFAPPLLDDADATHASAARNMALTGDLVTLRVDGVRYLEKAAPPLLARRPQLPHLRLQHLRRPSPTSHRSPPPRSARLLLG